MSERRNSPKPAPDAPKKYTGRDVLLEAYRRMDLEFERMGFPTTHPSRVRLRNIVEGGLTTDDSAIGELGRLVTQAALVTEKASKKKKAKSS